ncbi:MAG: hypothetical protein K8T89_16610 [Planctomycetes bacterium]|nr:hypothetical protein [Planctomycetota bacterium]
MNTGKTFHSFSLVLTFIALAGSPLSGQDLSQWTPHPSDWKGSAVADGKAPLTSEKWSYLRSPDDYTHVELSANVTIAEAAKQFRFFGQSWSAWPDPTFGDAGFEAALLLRADERNGYRVQISHKYQVVALVKYPEGGYVRVVPCAIKLNEPHAIRATVNGEHVIVSIDGAEKIHYVDASQPLEKGAVGIGTSSSAKVTFSQVAVKAEKKKLPTIEPVPHTPKFSVRKFLGDRQWVFDGDEPILQLHHKGDPSCFAKLTPGYKPQLTFDSHWGIENQGAFPDGANKWTEPTVKGSGETLTASWSARNVKDRFTTRSTMIVGYDTRRGTYTFDVDSELEVLPGEPFHFRYGFDFEHHTPLDPFRWQYLIAKKKGGELYHRPVYPIDPGPQNDLDQQSGVRVWYGRHAEKMRIAPAIEYSIGDVGKRKLNTAVCAAFYDTGVSFEPETSAPGTKIRVNYRYTGYPAAEADKLFKQSKIYDAPTLDPKHHYIFADEWPKLTFGKFVPMSETWIYGRTPFMTAHNTRPTYELEKNCGAGSGFAMKLGPASFGKANLPLAAPLAKGNYAVTALVKSVNAHGPGGRIELEIKQAKTAKTLAEVKHFVGNGSFDWKRQGFVFAVPDEGATLAVAFGNAGTGEMLVTDVEFRLLKDGEPLPAGVAAKANDKPPVYVAAPSGAIADYRMEEGNGHHVLNYAGGSHLDLANLDWVVDSGRPALKFADNTTGRKDFRIDSQLNRSYLSNPGYAERATVPAAVSGHHGGGEAMKGLTLAAWIKPAAEMGKSSHGGRGDIIGYGARRFILSLHGQKAPYQLAARINVNDTIPSDTKLEADRWYHVAMTAEPADGQWRVRLYVDGKAVGEGMTKKFPADSAIVPSLVLGVEIFYFHDAFYRGLIGRTLVFNRTLKPEEIAGLAK